MAEIVVNSQVMRDKAKTISTEAEKIQTLFTEMLNEVNTTASKMKGETIETEKARFANMQKNFETFATDMKSYGSFLEKAAESYEANEAKGTTKAEEQGNIF